VPASAAADASARFPYFGPLGILRRHDAGKAGPAMASVVDGGYFENFGATSLLDLLDALDGLARQKNYPVRFIVLQIISDPDLAMPVEPVTPAPERPMRWLPAGIAGPGRTLLLARQARGLYATEALARRVTSLGGTYVPVRHLLRLIDIDAPRRPAAEAMTPDEFMPMLMAADCPPTGGVTR
jgi:hypothetical protein